MFDWVRYGAGWFVAAAVSFGVAWLGVDVVAHQLTDDRPQALSDTEIARSLDDGPTGRSTATTIAGPGPTALTTIPVPTVPAPGDTTATTPSVPAPTAAPPTTTGGGATATTRPTTVPATPTTAPTVLTVPPPTTTPPATATTRTSSVTGGSAAVRFTSAGAEIVWATPAAGYEVRISAHHDNGVRIEFEDDGGRIDAWWAGAPADEVRQR